MDHEEIHAPMVSPLLIPCTILAMLLLLFFQYLKSFKNPPRPPGPIGLPIIGNIHQLDKSTPFYLQLWQLSKKYGPLFSLQFGFRPAIVVSSPKLAKEVMKNYDRNFSGRPKLLGAQKLTYNGLDIVFSPYNENWREIKKICVIHLLSSKRVPSYSSIRHFEVKHMIEKISRHASSSKFTNLFEVLMSVISTITCRIAIGKRYEDEGNESIRFHALMEECAAMLDSFFVSDHVPFSGWIDKLTGLCARLERNFKELDKFYQEVIEEHMDPNRKTSEEKDIVDILLELKKQRSSSIDISVDHIKAVLMNILLGATDTTAETTIWAMTELIKNPRVMRKVQEEIRSLTGKKDFLEEEDIQKFSYFKAMIKETFRLHLPLPLLIARETSEKCILDGYEIPAKALVFVNAWAIQRDPEAWKDPEKFLPERFLDSDIDLRGQHFELIPFGAGRRICPGFPMALANLELILANLLYSFDWDLPSGIKREHIDTEMQLGIGQRKKNPLCLLAKCHKL